MILIESVKTRHVVGPSTVIHHLPEGPPFGPFASDFGPDGSVRGEVVYAERFRTHLGCTVEIGMTDKVRQVLGLPMGAYQEMHKKQDELDREILRLRWELKTVANWSWLQRFLFLVKPGGNVV